MTTEEASNKLVILLLCAVSVCVFGSFVVTFDIKAFIYLIIMFEYVLAIIIKHDKE